jgi:predicted RNA binding protein YcfA (HicA-like mRNA interferase family)
MASQLTEIQKQLKKNGWKLARMGTKHAIYEKDGKTMLIPRGSKVYSRSYKQILWKIQGKTDQSKENISLRNIS